MEDEAEVIKKQMEDTRTSLSDKLEKLETKVVSTVQETTEAVQGTVASVKETIQGTVDAVQGTVGAVKDSVTDTVDSVREKVQDTFESVKDSFDLRRRVEQNPWAMFGGSVAVGFLLGKLLPAPRWPDLREWAPHPGQGNGRSQAQFPMTEGRQMGNESALPPGSSGEAATGGMMSGLMSTLGDALSPALDSLKEMAIGTATGVLGELVYNQVPEQMKQQVRESIDQITTKLGGRKLWEPGESGLFQSAGAAPAHPRMGDGSPYHS